MTVEANSSPPIHQRRLEIGLAEALSYLPSWPFSLLVLVQFLKTPKALANFSLGLERSDNPRKIVHHSLETL